MLNKLCVHVIDLQPTWSQFAARVLRKQGVIVTTSTYPPEILKSLEIEKADLIILGCEHLGSVEKTLIQQLSSSDKFVLLLIPKISSSDIRDGFILGARNVASKPYDGHQLLRILDQTLEYAMA